jgi:hypothetical protein
MLAACLLLAIAVLSGTMLAFLFDPDASRAARIAMGACLGPALLASVGFLLALWLGLNAASIALSAGILLLPLLLLLHAGYRARVLAPWRTAPRTASQKGAARKKRGGLSVPPSAQNPRQKWGARGYWFFYAAIAILLGLVFSQAVFARPDGIFTGVTNNLGDLPLHLQVINSFTQGRNLPPEDPTFAGVRFAYPFLVDFLAAMLARAGAGVLGAMWLQNMVMGLALVGAVHSWTLSLTRNARAGIIAPLLVLFSGGLGWWLLFSDVGGSEGSFSFFAAPPHDYTILPNSILRWGNSLTTLFVPQRSILFGMPLAILVFGQWWAAIGRQEEASAAVRGGQSSAAMAPALESRESKTKSRMIFAGICAGLLPLIHAHTFLVVMAMAVCFSVLFRSAWRSWALFFAVAVPLSLPEVFWLAHTGGVQARSYLGWQPGWDHGGHNVLWFWFVNAGPFILALLAALLSYPFMPRPGADGDRLRPSPGLALPPRLIRFYAPFILCFLVPNLVKLAPWIWDNIKVLYWWYIASVPLVALLLAKWWELKSRWRWLAPVAFASMTLAGGLDVLRVITAATEQREFTPEGIAIARDISAQAAPQARVLHAPTYNTPVFLTGRRSLLGYPGWMWSRGLDYGQRYSDIQRIYSGEADAGALLRQYGVDYMLVGPEELAAFRVDERFLSQYKKLAEAGPYRLYQVHNEREK